MFGNAAVGKDQKSNLFEMGTKTSFTNKNEQTVEEKPKPLFGQPSQPAQQSGSLFGND